MPKKASGISPKEQSERFERAVHEMVAAGELSLTEATERFERILKDGAKISRKADRNV